MTNKYDDMLDDAEEMSEAEIAKKLSEVGEFDIDKLKKAFEGQSPEEKKAIETLIDDLKAAADGAEKRRAWSALGMNAGMTALKLAKKAIMAAVAIALLPLAGHAGVFNTENPVIKKVVAISSRTRVGIGTNLNAKSSTAGYVPLIWDKKRSYWDIGFGVSTKKFNKEDVYYGGGFSINLLAMTHDAFKNVFGDRVGFLDLPGVWLGVKIESPKIDHIDARWDYKEKINFELTYAFFGNKKEAS